ncbi:SAM hydrolase/SAM-dependent halogenase family protein [Denitrobaculum tricleocarpae]|uniref:SAM-dependent chlorinase/fluorinase n=1 Tax=Denitrobaculum tricleocarpae TaxID=2591009 RepID=A0A545TMF3_9PROT|nr:SAM-dependent chlorinase/fluorinase [Denitrobaculum tricleocarpae]TQV78417.1 SAM-dependent chlorinase/fluorinase [Denitrobaculum tricleocarpae]
MFVLFTDFGLEGPYSGQVKAVLHQGAPARPVIDLFADAPAFDPRASAYLLAAYSTGFPAGSIFLAVVDPGVGSDRAPVILEADGHSFIGPDNGILDLVARRAEMSRYREILWRPERLSASFHGRDLFAPVAVMLARGDPVNTQDLDGTARPGATWPNDLAEIVYIDCYGNAMTGLRASEVPAQARLTLAGMQIAAARTFSDVPAGKAFWYENANGLVEIAVNGGHAAERLGLAVGTALSY